MKVISSGLTFFTKYIVPGVYAMFAVAALYSSYLNHGEIGWVLVVPALFFFVFLTITIGQYKKVSIVGDHIVVSNYFKIENIPANELSRVVENRWIPSRHICLVFKRKTSFGSKVLFMPKTNLNIFTPHPIVSELELVISNDSRDT